jgi:hypothetical protein
MEWQSVKNGEEVHTWKIDEPDFGLLTRSVITNNIHQMVTSRSRIED